MVLPANDSMTVSKKECWCALETALPCPITGVVIGRHTGNKLKRPQPRPAHTMHLPSLLRGSIDLSRRTSPLC